MLTQSLTSLGLGVLTTTLGTDLSASNGKNVDFRTFRENGIKFVIHKASQGARMIDSTFQPNVTRAIAAGIRFQGAYFWYEPRQDPLRQAALIASLWSTVILGKVEVPMPIMFDFEDDDRFNKQGLPPVSPKDLVQGAEACAAEIIRLTKSKILLYTGKWFWRQSVASEKAPLLSSLELVHAQYPRVVCPGGKTPAAYALAVSSLKDADIAEPFKDRPLLWWQFDGDKGLYLPQGTDADFDIFAGSEEELEAHATAMVQGRDTIPAPKYASSDFHPDPDPAPATSIADEVHRSLMSYLSDEDPPVDDAADTLPDSPSGRKKSGQIPEVKG